MRRVEYHKAYYDPENEWMVTPQEAYTRDEWDEYKHTCRECKDEFVLYFSDDTEARGRPATYCSPECRLQAKRRDAREWKQRNTARALAVATSPRGRRFYTDEDRARLTMKTLEGSHAG
jgi:hypothetical protein